MSAQTISGSLGCYLLIVSSLEASEFNIRRAWRKIAKENTILILGGGMGVSCCCMWLHLWHRLVTRDECQHDWWRASKQVASKQVSAAAAAAVVRIKGPRAMYIVRLNTIQQAICPVFYISSLSFFDWTIVFVTLDSIMIYSSFESLRSTFSGGSN
jgi:hypothetical protein